MTLNIILTTSKAVHVGADFRLTDANSGEVITELSPKVLVLREGNWEAILTYCGVGRWQARDTSNWVETWVQHDSAIVRSFEETATLLEREGNKWLDDIRRRGRYTGSHSFILAGLVRGSSKVALISNYHRLRGRSIGVAGAMTTEYASPHRRIQISGMAGAVSLSAKKSLLAGLRRRDDVGQIQRQIGRVIAAASQLPEANDAIGASSFTYSILPNGQGQGHLHGDVQGGLEVISIVNGVNPLDMIRKFLGPNLQITPTAHASINRETPIVVERCDPELEDLSDKDGSASGFRIIELLDLGSGHARACAINSAGLVVGQSNRSPNGPLCACSWAADGNPEIIVAGPLSSWAADVNDAGQIAGTLHLADGSSRAFLAMDGRVHVCETLGGSHSNAHALNNRGEVVGGSWSIPGNTAGDKRERAFKWLHGERMEDLGALGDDWCSRAADINDHGTTVGHSFPREQLTAANRAFIWTRCSGIADLGSLDGFSACAIAINNRCEVIGLTRYMSRSVSFIWSINNRMRLFPLPEKSSIRAINDEGAIVYTRETIRGSRSHVLMGGCDIALPCYRGHQSEAAAINNRGDIVGHVWKGNHGHAVKWCRV